MDGISDTTTISYRSRLTAGVEGVTSSYDATLCVDHDGGGCAGLGHVNLESLLSIYVSSQLSRKVYERAV